MLPKFRIYVKKENRMILPTEFSQIIFDYHGNNICIIFSSGEEEWYSLDEIIQMPSTNFLDRSASKQEIFAGDILESRASENPEDWKKWVVQFNDGAFEVILDVKYKDKRKKPLYEREILCEDNIEFYYFHKVGSAYSDGQG